MKAKTIYYKELVTTGNYNNRELAIELEIEDGEKAADVLQKARLFVKAGLASDKISPDLIENICNRLKHAQNAIDDLVSKAADMAIDDEIPF